MSPTAPKSAVPPTRAPLAPTSALPPRQALALAALAGFLYFLAFPGIGLWPLGFVALVPLIVALDGQSPKRALQIGWVAGLTMTSLGFYWLLDMLQTFSGFPTPICVLFLLLLCAYQGGRIGLLGWLAARGRARGHAFGLVFVLGFVASETVYPLIFPWSYAAVVHRLPALIQTAELGGPLAVALPLVLANWGLAQLWLAHRAGRKLPLRGALVCLGLPAIAALYGALRLPSVDARSANAPRAEIGLVQANMSLFGKREEMEEGLRRHIALTRELVQKGATDLVFWSETSVMSPILEQELDQNIPRAVGRHLGVPALIGSVLARPVDDARQYVLFNSALLTDQRGAVVGRYDKHYRLPFGEFLPLGDTFPILYEWSPHSGRFAAGTSLAPLRLGTHQIATFICYEDVIPSFVRSIVASGDPDLLANLTNDAWFGDTTEPWIHLALAQFRAVEHRRYFVRSTNSGVSAVIDPAGRVLVHTQPFEETTLRASIGWLRGSTPYGWWGDAPWWLLSAISVALAFSPRAGQASKLAAQAPGQREAIVDLDEIVVHFRKNAHAYLVRRRIPNE